MSLCAELYFGHKSPFMSILMPVMVTGFIFDMPDSDRHHSYNMTQMLQER